MKFFTLDAYESWYGPVGTFEDSGMLDAAYAGYRRHLEAMEGVLPEEVLALARLPGVDDGLVVEVHHILSQRTLLLVLRCGDLQVGYYDLVITYEGAVITPRDEWTLARIARATKDARRHEDLYYHEVDRTDEGYIEHRLLFHPGRWFAVRCRELHWNRISRPDRELPRLPDRFPGGPTHPPRRVRSGRLNAERVRR